jgi:Spy/CpxP family protein refolding chaperone
MQRLDPVFLLVITFVLGVLLEVAPVRASEADAVDSEADLPRADAAKPDRAKGPIPGGPNDENALWWNDPKIAKSLSLTDEQREKMGEILKVYRQKVPQDQRPEAFHEALVQGDWKAAHGESEKLAKSAETSVRMRGTLKIDVLSLLSDEQREILVDRYPRLVYQRWRRAMRPASTR